MGTTGSNWSESWLGEKICLKIKLLGIDQKLNDRVRLNDTIPMQLVSLKTEFVWESKILLSILSNRQNFVIGMLTRHSYNLVNKKNIPTSGRITLQQVSAHYSLRGIEVDQQEDDTWEAWRSPRALSEVR